MHKKVVGDEDGGDEDHDTDGSYKTPFPPQQQQHLNQCKRRWLEMEIMEMKKKSLSSPAAAAALESEQIDRSCLRMWQPLPIGFGGGGSFAINRFNIKDTKKHER